MVTNFQIVYNSRTNNAANMMRILKTAVSHFKPEAIRILILARAMSLSFSFSFNFLS